MKYSSIILTGLIGSVLSQPQAPATPQQEMNSIGACIRDNNCGNDLACKQRCNVRNTATTNSILKLQKCLGDCDRSLPIAEYQKCTNACNSNYAQDFASAQEQDKFNAQNLAPTSTSGASSSSNPTSGSAQSSSSRDSKSSSLKNYEFKSLLTTLVSVGILINLL
ncbi:hypothetical protein CONCODRAFT_7278 [Conidiobolus coronatus NRRL 28638]|uniref:Extracellular membrane protein CFEM domain-containing protein n=1 Tax=Conidiobolus coronatus (strain ATCC 28846 / CBS 209.66 / NRRL 28638) TaxID=796925 RepID=A0A137P5I6_CONC2|nr:hypothetical protein CONCODRAFT_7278 [Conidiobolus coronatus NRRL 28638]|eukprot:KXN70194.1 hypothetical protein CONCODRAFT_7278 [Conidiobolus coronatus NRRL 28638]